MREKTKILMVVMGMAIGGAETHVLELSLELKRMGYDIMIASNGGVYEKELGETGIRHFKLPLHNKHPLNMLRSYLGLKRIIKEEKVDIVHGHARIPSFICGLLQKRMKFPFITTAHWVFNTKGILKYISNWGQKTIAVSEDIRTYLMDNYHVPEEDITVTINGIDTHKFSNETDASGIEREFGLTADKRRIVYVSRMDDDRSLVAFQLAEIANELNQRIENLEIVIVGSGNSFDRLSLLAAAVNLGAKRELIKLTGARTDINKFIKTGEIFIGVSRAALEAMSCQKPVIVVGNEGYIGVFDEDKLPVSIATNFTCRSCPSSTKEKLYEDVIRLMCDSDKKERERLGSYARQVILDHYSVRRMAQDCITAYDALPVSKMRRDSLRYDALISGYYGFKNNGDDALLSSIIDNLKICKPDINICVMSRRPSETRRLHGIDAINRYNFCKVYRTIKRTTLLISGGGSLVQDFTSTHSLIYYLWVIKTAQFFGVKTMLYANGIGPLQKKKNRDNAAKVLKKIDLITLREPESLQELKRIGVMRDDIVVTADPAFCIHAAPDARVSEIFRAAGILRDTRLIGISVRHWKAHDDMFEANIAKVCDYIYDKLKLHCVFLIMQHPNDIGISREIMDKMHHNAFIISENLTDTEMMGVVSKLDMLLGERLHSLIYATAAGTPFVGIAYEPKIKSFMEYVGQEHFVPIEELSFDTLQQQISTFLDNIGDSKAHLAEKTAQMRERAVESAKLAVELMERD